MEVFLILLRIPFLFLVVSYRQLFRSNSDVQNISTGYNSDLHLSIANLTVFKKGVFYSGIKIFNNFSVNYQRVII